MNEQDALRSLVDGIVRPHLARRKHLSVVVGIITEQGREVFQYGPHVDAAPPVGQPLFEIGSVTKLFTATLLAALVQESAVRLDDPVNRYLPSGVRLEGHGAAITLEHLATHTSGLPRLPKNLRVTRTTIDNPYAGYTEEQLYAFLIQHRPRRSPPAPFAYSNLGMGLLGHVLARALGLSYEEAVIQRICLPLGLADTVIHLDPGRQARLLPGHSTRGKQVPNWDLSALAGAGALRSTAEDLLTFLAANMGLLATPLAPAMELAHRPRAAVMGQSRIGLGWMIDPLDGETLLWHNGATGGYQAYIGFIKERRVGVCVLANQSPSLLALLGLWLPLADAIGLRVLNKLR